MATTPKTDIGTVATSAGSILTNGASKRNEVITINLHNTNTTAEAAELYFVPNSGGSVGTAVATGAGANRIFKVSLAPDEVVEYAPKAPDILSATNDSIQAKTTTASKVVYKIGRIETDV